MTSEQMRVKFCLSCDQHLEWEAIRCHSCGASAADGADEFKECPECAETIKARAKRCRFCGHDLAGRAREPVPMEPDTVHVTANVSNPGVPTVMSFFYAGLGQVYSGRIAWGLAIMIVWPLLLAAAFFGTTYLPLNIAFGAWVGLLVLAFVFWVVQLCDAYRYATRASDRARRPRSRQRTRRPRSRRRTRRR